MNNDISSHSAEMSNILSSFSKLLTYIKVSDEAKSKKEELKTKINEDFDINKLDEYLNEATSLLKYSTNENKKIQEAFINGIKDNISTLFTTLTKTEGFRSQSNGTDNSLINLMNKELSSITSSIHNNDVSDIASSVASISSAVDSFRKEKEEQDKVNKKYAEEMREYAKKSEARLQKMHKVLHEREKELIMDKLTGVYNRRGYEDLKNNFYTDFMNGQELSVVIADIDDFKVINDTYGHLSGDSALAAVAKILDKKTGNLASVFRYGGEEFVLIFPNTPKEKAISITTSIKDYFTVNQFKNAKKEKIKLTLSFGFHTVQKGETLDEAYEIADQRLYKAKSNGKNQVVFQ
jgi:diguanylate cyclase (GGDEF)-like protein